MPRYTSTLRDRLDVAEGTMAFVFDRPNGFDFAAGQYVNVILPNPPHSDAEGNRRTFSIASPPHEAAALWVVTRMTGSAMKRSLAEVGLGTPIEILGPAGSFTLHQDASVPAVFIAGGIGITPFRSMVHDAVRRRLPHRITLIYSNRNPQGAAFHEELNQLVKTCPSLTYVPTMTQADKSIPAWSGERRYVNADFLRDHVGDLTVPIFYLAGPPGLVTGLAKVVIEAGGDPSHVHAEEFSGY
jgi:ferredoxin-NADP reductase